MSCRKPAVETSELQTCPTCGSSRNARLEIQTLRAIIARLEDWQNQGAADWCQHRYEDDVLVNRVIAECEAARCGIGVTYAEGDDPLLKLKRAMPSMEQLEASQRALREYRSRSSEKASELQECCRGGCHILVPMNVMFCPAHK